MQFYMAYIPGIEKLLQSGFIEKSVQYLFVEELI